MIFGVLKYNHKKFRIWNCLAYECLWTSTNSETNSILFKNIIYALIYSNSFGGYQRDPHKLPSFQISVRVKNRLFQHLKV